MAQVPELAGVQGEESHSLLPEGSRTPGVSLGLRVALVVGASVLLATGGASHLRVSRISPDGIIEAAGSSIVLGSVVTCVASDREDQSGKVTTVDPDRKHVEVDPGGPVIYIFPTTDCRLGGAESCSADGEDCRELKCCATKGSKCFKKNDYWASCNATCSSSALWEGGAWADKGAQHVWDCDVCKGPSCDASRECDIASCNGASGEQRQYCEEEKMRDCCLRDSCKGSQGEQVALCKQDHLDKCCKGKTNHCKANFKPVDSGGNGGEGFNPGNGGNGGEGFNPGNGGNGGEGFNPGSPPNSPVCDLDSCGWVTPVTRQATLCRETLQRNCCLEDACKGAQADQVDKCYNRNLAKCCAGKSPQCSTQ